MFAVAFIALANAGPATAQTIAAGDEVKTVFADKTAYITHRNGATQRAYFAANGTAKVTEKGSTRAGTWTIDKNTICHDLASERKCYSVTRTGPDTVELQSTDFKWKPAYKLVPGNPDKL